jgi:YaiO family outer membrane protein
MRKVVILFFVVFSPAVFAQDQTGAKENYLMVKWAFYEYTKGIDDERNYIIELSQKIKKITIITGYSNIHRFGSKDHQIGVDIYSTLGGGTKRWGYVALSISPDADFLPRWTIGSAIYQGYRNFEFSIGYTHMRFKTSTVDIFIPGVIVYFPYGVFLNERFYFIPKNSTSTLVSILNYNPNHKIRGFYSFAFGKSAEDISTLQDVEKFTTYSHRLGIEYRINTPLSIGAELYYRHRKALYDTSGISIFSRYWW